MIMLLKDLIGMVKDLPEESFSEVFEFMEGVKNRYNEAKNSAPVVCPQCGVGHCVKNGKQSGKQTYLCKSCRKGFTETSTSAISGSHSSATVWKAVIYDTVQGISINETAKNLDLTHQTVFNMRHKILSAVEQAILETPVVLEGTCEIDETYVLECEKGREFTEKHHRKPRKNGKASVAGLSAEQVCLCTSIRSDGKCTAKSVNRASPSKDEIQRVFGQRLEADTILLADGNKSYNTLKDRCVVIRTNTEDLIKINRFHSFIKERLANYRGVATIYLNRYAVLFSETFGKADKAENKIFELMTSRNDSFTPLREIYSDGLLDI
jgi:transposase-like protein